MDVAKAVTALLVDDKITSRVFKRRKDETGEDHASRCLQIAGAMMRRAYGRAYLDAPTATSELLTEAQRESAKAWAQLPIPK